MKENEKCGFGLEKFTN
jgi:hypothetical protein